MDSLSNFITSSQSTPRGLAYVAYGNPERYAQVKNQIRTESFLGSARLASYPEELIIDYFKNQIKSIFSNQLSSKYSFIPDSSIERLSSNLYNFILSRIDSISSYSDSISSGLSEFINRQLNIINIDDSKIISDLLIQGLRDSDSPEEIGFFNSLQEESNNDLTKLDSLPLNSVLSLKSNLSEDDLKDIGQSISSYTQDILSSIGNISDLVSSASTGLIGYPTTAIETPSDSNGNNSQNLSSSSFSSGPSQSSLFSSSILNYNLVASLAYDPNKDPFNISESSIYNLTPSLELNSGSIDSDSKTGSAFREIA